MKTVFQLTGYKRQGPVALVQDPDVLEKLGAHPNAPVPDLSRVAFRQYVLARLGYTIQDRDSWETLSVSTRGRYLDCWELWLEYMKGTGLPEYAELCRTMPDSADQNPEPPARTPAQLLQQRAEIILRCFTR